MRLFHRFLAAWFVVFGLTGAFLFVLVVSRGGSYSALIPASIIALGCSGVVLFFCRLAGVESDERGLRLTFLLHTERVAWDDIISYSYPTWIKQGGWRADAGNVWTVLTYTRADSQRPQFTAICSLPGVIENFLRVPDEWITVLDRQVPERNRTRGRESGR
jgi:hypothetical protein